MKESNLENQSNDYVGKSLFDFISVIVKYRKFLFLFIFLVTLITVVVGLLSPKWYKSTASVFPAEKTDILGELGGLTSLVRTFSPTRGLAGLAGPTETDRYLAILKSASVIDRVIKKFNLVEVYDITSPPIMLKTVEALMSNVNFEVQDEGNLNIEVYDKDPQRAADMANYFVELLNEINSRLHVQNAKANREFIEKRYQQNLNDIAENEKKMQEFQKKFGVVAVPEQLEATVKAMSEVYGELAKKEIEVSVLKRSFSEEHPAVKTAEIEVQELQKKINQLNQGYSHSDINVLIPFKKAPELGNEYLKIYRNLEIQYKILEFITPLYEQAKVEEVRNTPSVIVLDRAGPADWKSKPKILLYFLLSFIISTSIGLVIIVILEGFRRFRNADSEKFDQLLKTIQMDLIRIRRFRRK
jgi:uncharacterized protein involved in exopolysaccharide biosynthesis